MCDLNICRICLNTGVRGYKINEHKLQDSYEFILGEKISPKDSLPQWLCYECAYILHKFHLFKERCIKGQTYLKQIKWRGRITYDSVAKVNRHVEHLVLPLAITFTNSHVKTIIHKHKYAAPKPLELEKVLLNSDNEDLKHEDEKESKVLENREEKFVHHKTEIVAVDVKPELPLEPLKFEAKVEDKDTTNIENKVEMDDDIPNDDPMDNMSSDDENILLDIVKKAVNGQNKLVFLDSERRRRKKSQPRKKPAKFEKPKKQYFNPEHWRKFSLNEEDAMHEFKQREYSDKYVNANYKCHNCFKGFSKMDMLMRHVKFRHDESLGSLECRFCHMRFRLKCQLSRHIKQHYSVYQCLRCDMRFRLENSAIFHEDYHNGVIRKCEYCGLEFKHSSTYYTHVRVLHRSSHVCSVCGVSFVSEAGLTQHTKIKHFDTNNTNTEQTAESSRYCEKCDVKFASQEAYNEHLAHSANHDTDTSTRKNVKGNKIICANYSESRKKKPTTCQYCGKHFATQASCMKHHYAEHPRRAFHTPDQRHICEVCGASLAAVSIASHMNRHTREHVYPCATCGMQFISKSSHHRHQVTHTGERPYPCPLCEKRFTQKNSMQLHYRTFHLKQPYPKRNRRKKTDEMPIMESCRDIDSLESAPPARWRLSS